MGEAKSVLIIDDDTDFLSYIQIILEAGGYAVQTATDAQAGLEMMRRQPPDVVMVDVMISFVLDGWAIGREMRSDPRLREIPIIMVSAVFSDKDDKLFPASERSQVAAFMTKPVEPAALLNQIRALTQA
jgi:CheY-like chemotaxis protein